jgi:hypothetical protein
VVGDSAKRADLKEERRGEKEEKRTAKREGDKENQKEPKSSRAEGKQRKEGKEGATKEREKGGREKKEKSSREKQRDSEGQKSARESELDEGTRSTKRGGEKDRQQGRKGEKDKLSEKAEGEKIQHKIPSIEVSGQREEPAEKDQKLSARCARPGDHRRSENDRLEDTTIRNRSPSAPPSLITAWAGRKEGVPRKSTGQVPWVLSSSTKEIREFKVAPTSIRWVGLPAKLLRAGESNT